MHFIGAINWVQGLCQSIPLCGNTSSKNIAIHIQIFNPLPMQQHLVCLRRVSTCDNHLHSSLICKRKPYDSKKAENTAVKLTYCVMEHIIWTYVIAEKVCVYCAVRNETLHIQNKFNLVLKWFNAWVSNPRHSRLYAAARAQTFISLIRYRNYKII